MYPITVAMERGLEIAVGTETGRGEPASSGMRKRVGASAPRRLRLPAKF
jgi:hypothetical protein